MKLSFALSVSFLVSCMLLGSANADELVRIAPEEVGLSAQRLARFSSAMDNGITAGDFPGATAAIARNGKIAFFETYGQRDPETNAPMQEDSIFRIASMTKAVTGVAVMILYEEGHFRLTDPVSHFIPAFKNMEVVAEDSKETARKGEDTAPDYDEKWLKENWDTLTEEQQAQVIASYYKKGAAPEKAKTVPANRPITIRDLLRHTAGMYSNPPGIWEPGYDLGQMIDSLASKPLRTHPGNEFEYGLSMDVLARLVEVVSGQPFDVFIKTRIFDPLGMVDTDFWVPPDKASRLVAMPGDGPSDGKSKGGALAATYLEPPIILMGGTGLVSTTMDYLRFCQMLLNNGELSGARILGRKAVELMSQDHMSDVASREVGKKMAGEFKFGLTFGVKDKPGNTGALGSAGTYYWGGAYGTSFWIDPEENLIGVFMVNGIKDEKGRGHMPYSEMLEHFTYQALVD